MCHRTLFMTNGYPAEGVVHARHQLNYILRLLPWEFPSKIREVCYWAEKNFSIFYFIFLQPHKGIWCLRTWRLEVVLMSLKPRNTLFFSYTGET